MSFRTDLLPVIVKLRELPGPTGYDIYTTRVIKRTRTWSGGEMRLGTATDVDVELFPRPKVRDTNSSGGRVVNIGPITPQSPGGGYTPQELNPSDSDGVEVFYILIGPEGVERTYKLIEIEEKKPFRYILKVQALDRVTPY